MNVKHRTGAIAEREKGINRVADKAERGSRGWGDLAYAALSVYASKHIEFFPYEFTQAFEDDGFVMPHDNRAFGAAFRKAIKTGMIKRGKKIGQHPRRHASIVISWASLVYRGKK